MYLIKACGQCEELIDKIREQSDTVRGKRWSVDLGSNPETFLNVSPNPLIHV